MNHPDFLIVGAGIIGLSTAWQLARKGFSVEVIDCGEAGRESSWAGGGILFPLWPWDYSEAVTALTECGRTVYPQWVSEISEAGKVDPEYRQTGLLALPPLDIERAQTWCAAHDLQESRVTGTEISPLLAMHSHGLWLPSVAQVRNPRLIRSLVNAVDSCGVTIREHTKVLDIVIDKNRVSSLATTQGTISAGTFIVCAGAWSKDLLGQYAAGTNIFPVKGQMLLYATPPGTLDTIVLRKDHYLIPRADGHILAGTTKELVGFEKNITEVAAKELHDSAKATLPYLSNLQPLHHWAGLRPGSPANIPIISRHPDIENLYLNSGHFRYGLTMAPAAAQILTNLITGQPQMLDVTSYQWPKSESSKYNLGG
ncbi:MAG: glycine oxidase ThiO [Pseudomonadota bacterium]